MQYNSLVNEKVYRSRPVLDLDNKVDGAVLVALCSLHEPLQEDVLT